MEDSTVKIKIDVEYNVKNAQEAEKVTETVKENAKETNQQFGIGDTALGKFWNSFKTGGTTAINTMKTLKGAIIATGIGALVVLVMGLVEWFKKTETGSDLIAKSMKVLGQVIKEGPIAAFNTLKIVVLALLIPMRTAISTFKNMKDVLTGKQSLKEAIENIKNDVKSFGQEIADTAGEFKQMGRNIQDAAKLADAWDALEDRRRDNKVKDKQIDAEIADLRERAFDAETSMIEKVNLLQQALEKLRQQYIMQKADKEEEIRLIEEELRLYPDNQEWIEKLATAKGELYDIERGYSQQKRTLGRAAISTERQITENARKEAEEQEKIKREQAEKEKEIADKRATDVRSLLEQNALLKAEDDEKELLRLEFKYAKEQEMYAENAEALKILEENYNIERQAIIDAAAEEWNKKIEDNAEKQKKINEEEIASKLAAFEAEKNITIAKMSLLDQFGNFLMQVAGESRELAYAGLLISKAAAIGTVIAQTAIANAKMVAQFPITLGQPWVAINTASAVLSIATLIAETAKQAAQINSAGKAAKNKHVLGTASSPGGLSLVGENGPELLSLPQGTAVYNNAETNRMLAGSISREEILEYLSRVVAIPVVASKNTSYDIYTSGQETEKQYSRFVTTK